MSRPLVLVTKPEFRRGEPAFASCADLECMPAPEDEASLADMIARLQARYLVVGSVRYTGELYSAMPRGGVIARFGVGHDNVDKVKATQAGLLCTNTPDVLQQSVAELTLLMIAAAARHFERTTRETRDGEWILHQGIELAGKTLAIIGCGAIGTVVARMAANGFGMHVIGYGRHKPSNEGRDAFEFTSDDFGKVVRDADFVSLHIPGSPENAHFIDKARLDLFPGRAWLINTARGAVVDETELYDALIQKRIAGAAVDVFEREPYQPVDPGRDLRTLPNVILLPHIGSHTVEANRRMAERALQNIRLADARNFAAMDLLNPQVLTGQPAARVGEQQPQDGLRRYTQAAPKEEHMPQDGRRRYKQAAREDQ